jgi:hypothetical protein
MSHVCLITETIQAKKHNFEYRAVITSLFYLLAVDLYALMCLTCSQATGATFDEGYSAR